MKVTTWTVRKALNAISDDNKTSIHCYEFYASPVISKPRYFELFSISLGTSKQRGSTVVTVGLSCHTIFWGRRDQGRGAWKQVDAFCFLLTFIHDGGIWKVTIQPRLKNGTIFLVTKVFQKVQCSNECILSPEDVMQWSATMSSVCTDLLSQAQLKSPFGEFCFSPERRTKTVPIAGMAIKFENHKYPLLHYWRLSIFGAHAQWKQCYKSKM